MKQHARKKTTRFFLLVFAVSATLTFTQPSCIPAATEGYTVQQGDSLWAIAARFGVPLTLLLAENPQFTDPGLIHPGETVLIPTTNTAQRLEEQVITLVNKERTAAGLLPLTANDALTQTARRKSEDMRDNGYFNHQSPTYGSPFEMLKRFAVTYRSAGENIAKGQRTAQEVVAAWMDSEGHRQNILSAKYTQIGVGYAEDNESTYWTQLFITP